MELMGVKLMKKYWQIWWLTAEASIQTALTYRLGGALFLAGKFLRFGMFVLFLKLLHQRLEFIGGYSYEQMLTFYLIFNLFDLVTQIFFRGIYWFRNQVVSGEFDFALVKPMSALFKVLTAHTDILDVPLLVVTAAVLMGQSPSWSGQQILSVVTLWVSGFLIITAVHIAVAALGVMTTEVDHAIMVYRDISSMARFPIDIYTDWIRAILTFVIPVAVAFTFPAKAWLGLTNLKIVAGGMIAAGLSFWLSVKLWRYSLKQYSSASS